MKMKPVIGITAFLKNDGPQIYKVNSSYIDAIFNAGGIPLIIPVLKSVDEVSEYVSKIDGVIIPGGQDVAPLLYEEEPVPQVEYHVQHEDKFEFEIIKKAKEKGIPIFGICRGMQVINVAFGGTLYQDIPSQLKVNICHRQSSLIRSEGTHSIEVKEGSFLNEMLGEKKVLVNSYHHQSVKDVAPEFVTSATAPDGVIEAIENKDKSIFAVQWHPELMQDEKCFKNLFDKLIELSSSK